MFFYESGPMKILGHNNSSIRMTKESKISDAPKHIEIQYHYILEMVNHVIAEIQHIPSDENTADILTKGPPSILNAKMYPTWG